MHKAQHNLHQYWRLLPVRQTTIYGSERCGESWRCLVLFLTSLRAVFLIRNPAGSQFGFQLILGNFGGSHRIGKKEDFWVNFQQK